MAEEWVEIETWPRAAQFRLFRTYQMPHYAVTSRIDVTHLMGRKSDGLSTYRACLYAIGMGIAHVPELSMRFREDRVVRHDPVTLSMTVPTETGSFSYAYVTIDSDFDTFDRAAKAEIARAATGQHLAANTGERDDLVYLSCLPWLDFTSVNNALPGPDDCIPRVSWGKFVQKGAGTDMAMALEVHHALVDGAQVGAFFGEVQRVIDSV